MEVLILYSLWQFMSVLQDRMTTITSMLLFLLLLFA